MIVTEPRVMELIGRIQQSVEDALALNDPRVTTGNVGKASGKPESRPPGEQQCPWVAGEVERILTRCADKLDAAYEAARVRAHAEHVTPSEDWREERVSVGDDWIAQPPVDETRPVVVITAGDEPVQVLARKSDGKFVEGRQGPRGLAGKLEGVIGGEAVSG